MQPKYIKRILTLMLLLTVMSVSIYCLRNIETNSLYNSAQTGLSGNSAKSLPSRSENAGFRRNTDMIDYSGVSFNPWDVEAASTNLNKRAPKPYTIMIYMNGSDLESDSGAATEDLIEILESGVNTENVNIIIFTGGANRWQNEVVPENECVIWEITGDQINEVTAVGLVNMGDAGTLTSFIDFSARNFPAEKLGLILWDHGGGSIAGYGHDEKFNNSNLTLLDMNYAFEMSVLNSNKLEFLGFDSCLMASVEMAVVASEYALYLVASEDLTPTDGWDYTFLSVFNDNPYMDGAAVGKAITDYFMEYYAGSPEELNMSVIDLSGANEVMYSMGNLMNLLSDTLIRDRESSFRTLSKKRSGTKTFGIGSPRDNESDMVDIGDMAYKLSDLFTEESADILAALKKAVIYNRNNSDIYLSGLSSYYIYGGKDNARESLDTYASLGMDDDYTDYLNGFSSILIGGTGNRSIPRSRVPDIAGHEYTTTPASEDIVSVCLTAWRPIDGEQGLFIMTGIKSDIGTVEAASEGLSCRWPQIGGEYVCMYKIRDSETPLYAIPAVLNGRDCDIIVLISENYPDGKVLGARNEDGFIIQKGYDTIKNGDKISFYYQERYFDNQALGENKRFGSDSRSARWRIGREFAVKGELRLDWTEIRDENDYYYSVRTTDLWNNEYFSDLEPVRQ